MTDINPYAAPNSKTEPVQVFEGGKHVLPKLLFFVLFLFTGIVLLIDWLGIHVFRYNGLGFQVHAYSYGTTFAIAAVASFLFLRRSLNTNQPKAILLSLFVAAVWWVSTFILLFYSHGLFGGWY